MARYLVLSEGAITPAGLATTAKQAGITVVDSLPNGIVVDGVDATVEKVFPKAQPFGTAQLKVRV
jgi:hypothetical protein